jgi:hypothetical protein
MQAIEFILRFFRKRMLFIMALAVAAIGGFIALDGWSWISAIILVLTVCAAAAFWALVTFWVAVFNGSKRHN